MFSYTGNELLYRKTEFADSYGDSIIGQNYIISGNFLASIDTIHKMEETFILSSGKKLEERLVLSLEAGDSTVADYRGRLTASLCIYEDDRVSKNFN